MDRSIEAILKKDYHFGCFGDYNVKNPICHKHCVLRLRCAIEKDQNLRVELLEDLMESQNLETKIQ